MAEVTGNEKSLLGLSFKAGGAIAGFVIIFWLSQIVVLRFYLNYQQTHSTIHIKVYLTAKSNTFERNDNSYTAEYTIFNEDTGESKSCLTKPFWEAGYLTIMARDVGDKDYITIKISNSRSKSWESDSFHSRSPKIAELTPTN
ncbi:MAG: hypothetical protein MUF75_03340 [Bacteroidia bacterium]|nr:hypothetical protein [Bacteroidia bacterium]